MRSRRHPLERRAAATQAVIDRFLDKPFVWGRRDCGRLVAVVLRTLGARAPLAQFGAYSTELGARRALLRCGYASVEDFLDRYPLAPIGHASVLPADLLGFKAFAEDGAATDWLSIGVFLGNGRAFGFVNGTGQVVTPRQIERAWRSPCP